jgi:hypothetical protein
MNCKEILKIRTAKNKIMITQNKRLIGILLTAGFILLIPLAAMQFTHEVNWTLFDFMVAGGLLFGTGCILELVIRSVIKTGTRIALCIVLLAAFLLVWMELAVGVFGSPVAGS